MPKSESKASKIGYTIAAVIVVAVVLLFVDALDGTNDFLNMITYGK